MSQSGKRFLSGLVNRVFNSNSESRAAAKRRERSLSARRLGMEPLEDRQLLAVDPTLLSAAFANANQTSDFNQSVAAIDLSSIGAQNDVASVAATTGAGATLSVGEGKFEETTLSQSTQLAATVDDALFSNAAAETQNTTRLIAADISAQINRFSCSEMGWAATLANMLTYTGWGASSVVDSTLTDAPEQQILDYFADSFTNDPSSLLYAYGWFMGGPTEYVYQDQLEWAQIYADSTNGGLFPADSGQWSEYTSYAKEFRAAEIASETASPLYGIITDYLNNNYGVGVEVHYATGAGTDEPGATDLQARSSWLTLWGYDFDPTFKPTDVEYYTAVYMSNPTTGAVERMPIEWSNDLNSYVFKTYDKQDGRAPYIYSFTVIQRMPGWGVLVPDAYEANNSAEDFDGETLSDLGQIDVVVPSSVSGTQVYGNTFTLENLTLYAEGTEETPDVEAVAADPVDYYRFELTKTASHSDSIVVSFKEDYLNSPLKATLYVCPEDGEPLPINAMEYGPYSADHFDAVPKTVTEYYVGEDGKTYANTYQTLTLTLSGLSAGRYYLKVEFADDVVGGINSGYNITFNAGYDDVYETNNSFDEVNELPVSTKKNPTSNLGVLYGQTTINDLVLKQYTQDTSETDWYRFEMTAKGTADNYIELRGNSNYAGHNYNDLDLYLYKADPDCEYKLVDKSWSVETDVERVDLNGLEPGVYYIKVVGYLMSDNVEYKLVFNPGVDENMPPDLRAEVLDGNNWESSLVVTSERYVPSDTEAFANESILGMDGNVYVNYSFAVYGATTPESKATYENVQLGLFINGERVSVDDMRQAILESGVPEAKMTQMLDLFCNGGMTMSAGDTFAVTNFSLGKIIDENSVAGRLFDTSSQAANSVVIVINPDNYDFVGDFGKVVDNLEVKQASLTYVDGLFYDGTTNVSLTKGDTIKVYRNDRLVKELKYGEDFDYRNGDTVVANVVTHHYMVDLTDYTVKEDVQGVLEYVVDNNFSGSFFILNNLSEDVFTPNASVTDVMRNTNPEAANPDLGVANIEYLDRDGVCHIDNLVITGARDANDAFISDWFKFSLLTSQEDKELGRTNYEDAYVRIDIDETFAELNDPANLGDLDLYLYKVVQTDPTISFDEAFEQGAYKLYLVKSSKGVSNEEVINFSECEGVTDGTYFVCVSGFNGASNRYSLELGGFTHSGDIIPTDPSEYFTDDSVKILNSVATLNWRVPTTDYVSRVTVQYREKGTNEWNMIGEFKPSVTSCKVAGLSPDTEYEFKLSVTNFFIKDNPLSATVVKKTADFLNEVVYRAVIVGVSDYPGSSADLVAAANDATAFRANLLKDPQWASENITMLLNDDATKANVLDALQSISYVSDDNDVLVFYFAGSGSYSVVGGETVGYLKTYGGTRASYLSSSDLVAAVESIAAGSKQFILDAGQVAPGVEETAINYDAFIEKLTKSTKNGASDRVAQSTVLTSGENRTVSPVGRGSRSVFSLVLADAMEYYSQVNTEEDVEAAIEAKKDSKIVTKTDERDIIVSDGRVAFDEMAEFLNSDIRTAAYEMKAMCVSNDEAAQTIMMNGEWDEADAFAERWLEEGAIVVTTAVDTVDAHDGKVSLREAASRLGTILQRETVLKNGDLFTLGAGSVISVGTTAGTLVDDVVVSYMNGGFRTQGACSVDIGGRTIDFNKSGNVVTWTDDNWENVKLTDEEGLDVAEIENRLKAIVGSAIVDKEEFYVEVELNEGDVLYTAAEKGKELVVTKIGSSYRLTLDGVPYNKTVGLYRKVVDEKTKVETFEPVVVSSYAAISQDVVLNKIVFDASLAEQSVTVNANKGAIVFDKGAIVDATSMKGTLTFDGEGASSMLNISGEELVTLVGVKIVNANGSAIVVDKGADFELANSLVAGNNSGTDALFKVDGNMTFVNDTIANNAGTGALVAGAGSASMENTIVALNENAIAGFTFDSTCVVGSADPGFVDAANGDYTLVKTSDALDIGNNSAVKLRSGFVVEFDLAGEERIGIASQVDAGAFEYTVSDEDRETPSTVVTILEDIVDATDGEISLREAVAYAGTTYQVESELLEGEVVTDADGVQYEVKNGRFVSFEGVSAVQSGMYYVVEGVYFVDAYGEPTVLEEGAKVTLENGSVATVVKNKLQFASGIPVDEGSKITLEDGSQGVLSYGAVVDFLRNQEIKVNLTSATIDPSTPVGDFDAGDYVLTYQQTGVFKATLKVTTTDSSNQSTTTEFEAEFKLVDKTEFSFLDEEGQPTETAKIATSRSVDLEDGTYSLVTPIVEKIDGVDVTLYDTGALFTLTRGVFTDADGYVVKVPKGTQFYSPDGMLVAYQTSNFVPKTLEEGTELFSEDGTVRKYKEGTTLYEDVTLGKVVTFARGLESGTVVLEKGPISIERAITVNANQIGGLTIDAHGASRALTVDTYRETNATAYVNLSGLTLINGAAEEGGLVYVAEGSNLKLTDSTLENAEATRGGAIYNAGKTTFEAASKPTTISEVAALDGGAIYNVGTMNVTGATILDVSATNNGGAIYNGGALNVAGGSITNATANVDGGAVYNAGTLTVTKSAEFSGAKAISGGAIYNIGVVSLNNAALKNNEAVNGGALYNAAGKASFTAANIIGNSADVYGGAIYDAAQFFATRTIIADNNAAQGSAVYTQGSVALVSSLVIANGSDVAKYAIFNNAGSLTLTNDTIVGNSGGVNSVAGSLKAFNSIVGDNGALNFVASGVNVDLQNDMIENYAGSSVDYAPNFVSFDKSADWSEWNLRLGNLSTAIDAGSVDYAWYNNFNGVKTNVTVDFAGNPRLDGENVDIGAYEVSAIVEDYSTVVTTLEDIVDPTDGLVSLREAIRYASAGKTVEEQTVTFSNDLFALSDEATIYLSPELQTIVIGTSVIVTSEYTNEFGETQYRNITIDGSESNAPLFMFIEKADAEFRGLTFANGKATGDNPNGGAFIIRDGSVSLLDAKVINNSAERNGGAVYQTGGVFFVVDSLFYGNEAGATRGYGGAMFINGGQAYVYNTTIASNGASVYGGVFANDGLLVLANSIVALNRGAQNVDVYATNLEATSNLIGAMDSWRSVGGFNGNIVGSVLNPIDPQFENVAANDFHLVSGSLAINAGVNDYAYGPDGVRLKFDLDANERIVGVVDMGAFESGYEDVPSTVVTTLRDDLDQTDGLISLREAIEYAKQFGTPITFDLGDDFEGDAEIRLENGAIDVVGELVIDASNVPGGLTIYGNGDRIFYVHKSGTLMEDGTITSEAGALKLTNVALTGGTAARGGAIYMDGGDLNLTNVLIYDNYADEYGGAIYGTAGNAKLLNTTIAGNDAENYQGVYFAGTLSLENSIVAGNAKENAIADYNYDLYAPGKITSVASIVGSTDEAVAATYNGFFGNTFGVVDAMVDPGFVAAESFDFTLNQDSIAVNAGSNRLIGEPGYYASILQTASNVGVIKTDFAGEQRLVGGTVDIGAYEYQIATEAPSVVVTTTFDVVDPFDGLISLREAIDYAGSVYHVDGVSTKVDRTITFDPSLTNGVILLEDTLVVDKCVTIDATDLQGTLTIDAGQSDAEFNAITIDAQPDSVASEVYICGVGITGGVASYGGGVYHVSGAATLINCVVYGNTATYGAGIASVAQSDLLGEQPNTLTLINTTVTKNDSTGAYGGIWSRGDDVNLYNTIVAKNTTNGEDGADVYITAVGSMTSNLIGIAADSFARSYDGVDGNLVGTANSPYDPSFSDYENDRFDLARDKDGKVSIAVNAGENTLIVLPDGSVPATDAAANLRIIGGIVDIGAYESTLGPTELPSLMVTTLEDVVDPYDGLISLREATQYANNYGLGSTIIFSDRLDSYTFYLKEQLNLSDNLTIDGLANGVKGVTLTIADDVEDSRVLYLNAGDVVINGVTITNRYSERLQNGGNVSVDQGGAIYARAGVLSIYNSLITDNAAKQGSAIYINEGSDTATVFLINCTVVDNVGMTTDETVGAAIYSERGTLNLWNTIVAANDLENGSDAQDVFKGSVQPRTDVVVERESVRATVPELAPVPYVFENGQTITLGYRTLTYVDGVFYQYYGTEYELAYTPVVGDVATIVSTIDVTYQSDGWYVDGVAFSLQPQNGDTMEYRNAATGTTSTVVYYNGEYRQGSHDGKPVAFSVGDQLTAPVRESYRYTDAGFCRVNVSTSSSGWFRRDYVLSPTAALEYAQQIHEELQQDLMWRSTYTKEVNGVALTYPILSADVEISGYSAEISRGEDGATGYSVEFTHTPTYTYRTQAGASVMNSYVGRSESLASIVSGNGSFIGSKASDLTKETQNMFVDLENRDYNLKNDALATNGGDNRYFNERSVNGTFDSFDVAGNPRIYYTTVDMGAFENQTAKDSPVMSVVGTSIALGVTTALDVVDPTDGVTSLREALSYANTLASRGYDDITIMVTTSYDIRVDSTLGSLTVNSPINLKATGATIDCDSSACGLIIDTDGDVVISNLIVKNGVSLYGAGVKVVNGDVVLSNCLIYDCEATIGGGAVYVADGNSLEVYNSTISKNVAVDGCGIFGDKGSDVKIYNSILALNRSSVNGVSAADVVLDGDFAVYYSLIGNAGTKGDANKLNAKSVNSKIGYGDDNSIDPIFVDAAKGNYHISATSSPAKNAGSSAYVYLGSSDLDGNYLGSSANISMGAYQIGTEARSTVVTTLEDVVDSTDGLISLREAIQYADDNVYGAGCGSIDNSSYNSSNAMNSSGVYSATYYSPITFDPSLAGGTIVLNSPLSFARTSGSGSVYDYMIDGSSLSGYGNGGITIDCTQMDRGGEFGVGGAAFSVVGRGDPSNGLYWPVHLDVRNVKIEGRGGTAFQANSYGMVSTHNCLISGFDTGVNIGDNDSDQAGVAHIYNTTIIGDVSVGGTIYLYNSLVTGVARIASTQNNPGYRQVYANSTFINGYSGLARLSGSYFGGAVADQFIDMASGDYRLADRSLCINRGDNSLIQTLVPTHADGEVDANGNKRVLGTTVDMGCYENAKVSDMPSTTVTTTDDVDDPSDGLISIREAIHYAEQGLSGGVVYLSGDLAGTTVKLNAPISLTRNVTIDGGANDVTFDAQHNGSVFDIAIAGSPQANVPNIYIRNLTLTGGYTQANGGAINISGGNVYLGNLTITGNEAVKYGGAIYAYDSELTLVDCRIGGNTAAYYGGVVNEHGRTVLSHCYVAENVGTNVNAGADIWGLAPVNYVNSKNNVVGYVADNITLYNGVDGNFVGTAETPIKPFVGAAVGNLEVKPEWALSEGRLDEAFAFFADEEEGVDVLATGLAEELNVFDAELFDSFEEF